MKVMKCPPNYTPLENKQKNSNPTLRNHTDTLTFRLTPTLRIQTRILGLDSKEHVTS